MKELLTFNDVLITPKFSFIRSRKDVNITQKLWNRSFKLPIVSSNMDSVTGSKMINALAELGATGALHRFQSIEDNVNEYQECKNGTHTVFGSFGLGQKEIERVLELSNVGCNHFILDVAHGASISVVEQVKYFREATKIGDGTINSNFGPFLIVGNFATGQSIKEFEKQLGEYKVDGYKVGIGGGSACLTRVVTGCGLPTISSIIDCRAATSLPIIADGGMVNSGDICKALAAGANLVMLGGMLAGTDESPAETVEIFTGRKLEDRNNKGFEITHKKYRGSASLDSYKVQGKVSDWRSPEGDSFLVPYTGPVKNIIKQIEGGIRSCMSYVNCNDIKYLTNSTELVKITTNGNVESTAHGKQRQ